MIKRQDMKKSNDGFIWDPDAWRANRVERRDLDENRDAIVETEYQTALSLWHLKCNMEKTFGHKPWMDNVVDPAALQWDERGNRVRPKPVRTLNHTPPKQKRSL
jgi:hypothetical protein